MIHFTRAKSKDLPKDTGILWGNIYKCCRCYGNCKLAALHHPSLIGFGFWFPNSHLNVNNFISCLKAGSNHSFNWKNKTKQNTIRVTVSVWLPVRFGDVSWEGSAGMLGAHLSSVWVVLGQSALQLISMASKVTQTPTRRENSRNIQKLSFSVRK